MSDLQKKLASLSPEKRKLLEKKLKEKAGKLNTFPLSFAQQRLWFLNQFESDKAVYNLPSAFKLIGKMDFEALKKSINEIVKRHESLRTVFNIIRDEPVQVILKSVELDIPFIDFQNLPEADQTDKIKQLIMEEVSTGFDLKKGPLLRLKVVKTAADEHVIVLVMHHIISDGWSMGVFTREIAVIYNSIIHNQPIPLPPLKIQYADFAKWQRKYLSGKELEKQIGYWKDRLGDIPPALQLPYDKKRGAHQTFSGTHIRFQLSDETSSKLNEIARRQDATLFMVLLASFQALLYRYTGQDDISVGTAIANRNRAEIEGLIGFFVNTLVLRTSLDGDPTFTNLVNRVKDVTLGAYAHQDLPYEKMVEAIQPKRDLSAPPLFQVFFTLTNRPTQSAQLSDFKIEPLKIESTSVKFDLTLSVDERENGLMASLGYNTDLFNEQTIRQLIAHYVRLLDGIAQNPDLAISAYSLLSPEERAKLLHAFNQTDKPVPQNTLHALFEQQAEATPHSDAVHFPHINPEEGISTRLTYNELNQKANQVAHYLIRKGIIQNQVVGLCMERAPEMIIATLGILKAGGAYLPIEPSYPEERIRFMVEDTSISVLLTQQQLEQRFAPYQLTTLALDKDWAIIENEPVTNPGLDIDTHTLAYIIYTSGSTGKPKGVMIRHSNVVNYVHYARELFKISPEDRVLQFASISFDAAAEEIYPALTGGATLVLRNDAMISSASTFLNSCERFGITVIDLPTAYWHQIHSEIKEHNIPLPSGLRLVIIGGERAIPEYILEWQKTYGKSVRLLNTYGPTETTIVATVWELPPHGKDAPFLREVPIGKPVDNVQAYVLDRNLQPVPLGVPGELVIGGAGVAAGYLNRPELSNEKFLPNPFLKKSRIYRTGDLVRFLKDGNIEFLGRIDQQVKIRGFRIELGEVEAAIRRLPHIEDVVLLAREDTPGERRLVAYFVPESGKEISAASIRSALKEALPDYMVPAFFIPLDKIPISSVGKTDYRALPAPDSGRPELEKEFVAPRNELENFLAKLLQDVLKIEKVGIHDNFFELGGDSLKAAIFINSLQQELDEILYVVVLFDNQTIEELATYLTASYPQTISKKFGIRVTPNSMADNADGVPETLTEAKIQSAQKYLSKNTRDSVTEKEFLENIQTKLPRAFFVLSAPRSGSTLLRVMLAGNKHLFSPPELALLKFRTMRERKEEFSGRDSGWMEGLHRAVMEIKNCSFEQAKEIIAEMEKNNLTTQQAYAKIQGWIKGRIIVDKTTTYATDLNILKRGEAFFEDAFYIQITRHPAAMIQSYIDSNLDQVFGSDLPFTIREKAELFWLINNSNIERFFLTIPDERKFVVQYEDLVTKPEEVMRRFCTKAGIPFDEDMLKPYEGNKMRDGVVKESRMVGDPRFNSHKGIDKDSAHKWQTLPKGDHFYFATQLLAEKYKYKIAQQDKNNFPQAPFKKADYLPAPLSFAQQRLWFLDQMESGSPLYNIPSAVRMKGTLHKEHLERSLSEIIARHESLRSVFLSQEGNARVAIAPPSKVTIPVSDFRKYPNETKASEVESFIFNEIRKPFHLSTGPLYRFHLIQTEDDEYIFVMALHHIVSDGWSSGIFVRELIAFYTAFCNNQQAVLPPLELQYADFALWQRNWLSGKNLEEQLDYWRNQLDGAPPAIELPTDRPYPPTATYNGSRLQFRLDHNVGKALKSLSKEEGATLFMTLLAAFQLLLSRYSGQKDISVGSPIAGRNRREVEPLIGLFVNTLVFRTDLNGSLTFRQLIKRVQKTALGAFAHQDLPFEKLLDSLNIKRDVSRSPLFQVMFMMQNIPSSKIEIPDLTLSQIALENAMAKFELTLEMSERHDGTIAGGFEYNTDLFDRGTIEGMVEHLQMLLQTIAADPDQPLEQLSLLTPRDRKNLFETWNGKAAPYQITKPIHRIFEEQARTHSEAVALYFNEAAMTYGELNRRSNQLAHFLIKKDIHPDDLVALSLHRSFEMVIAVLGILKSGAAYVPLDASYPKERLDYILNDSGAKLLLTETSLSSIFSDHQTETVLMDSQWQEIEREKADFPIVPIDPDNLAYMIYTSGSTGKPKGVLVPHSGLIHYLNWCATAYPLQEGRGSVLHSTLAFDATVSALFTPFLHGKSLTIVPESDDLNLFGETLLKYQDFSMIKLTPAHLFMLSNQFQPEQVRNLTKAFVIGGENLSADQIEFWQRNAPGTKLFNEYGPTETVVGCVVHEARNWHGKGSVPIGHPIANTRVYVLDSSLQPVIPGTAGELYIGGPGVTRGYHNRPDLTAERFIPDPFSGIPGSRMYKSGDRVKHLKDGKLEFLNRIDNQVKIRGYRIELAEIEANLMDLDSVENGVVLVKTDHLKNKRLVAWYRLKKDAGISNDVIRTELQKRLPDYMVPSVFIEVKSFPLTPNGKIDYDALPDPSKADRQIKTEFVAPSTEQETILAEVWQELLNTEKVGVNDNFFEMGGDSILAIQMIARVRQHGLQITPVQLFKHQTIAELAAVISSAPIIEAEQSLVSGSSPLTPIQHFFFEKKFSEPNHWNQSVLFETKEPLDPEILKKTVAKLLEHHDVLRSHFKPESGKWVQEFRESSSGHEVQIVEAAALNETKLTERINEMQASLDIQNGPVCKIIYYDRGSNKNGILQIIIHHLAMDGVSWRILLEDFQTAYKQFTVNVEPTLPLKTTSFKRWAEELQKYAQSKTIDAEKSFWLALAQKDIPQIPVDFPEGSNTEADVETFSIGLNQEQTASLIQEAPPVYNTQINDLLLTALVRAFARWSGKRSMRINLEGHGRENISPEIDISRTIGWFTTMYPVFLDLKNATQDGDTIKIIKEELRAIPNKGIGFGLLRYLSSDDMVQKQLAILDQPGITFNYLGQFDQTSSPETVFKASGFPRGKERSETNQRTALIDINGAVSGGKLSMSFGFSKKQFRRSHIEEFATSFQAELIKIIEHCKHPDAGGKTASDFNLAKLNDKKLDQVMAQLQKGKKKRKNRSR